MTESEPVVPPKPMTLREQIDALTADQEERQRRIAEKEKTNTYKRRRTDK